MNLLDLARSALIERRGPDAPVRQWRISYPDAPAMDVLFTPPVTADEVAAIYPGAMIEPLADDPSARTAPKIEAIDPAVERRRDRALAILADEPDRHIAVIAETGDPAHVTVAVRGVAVGELDIPAEHFDGFALLALMQQYGHA
jgi:hypothetical protein